MDASDVTSGFIRRIRIIVLAVAVSLGGAGAASAYVGDSFLGLPGIAGGWQGAKYRDWVRVSANQWTSAPKDMYASLRLKNRFIVSGPVAPKAGASSLVIAVDKHSPALAALMDRCTNKTAIPEITYAESANRARTPRELGALPADAPEYFEYKLKDVQITDCPIVADAPEQAFVVSFNDIAWLNYRGDKTEIALKPVNVPLAKPSPKTKSFVVTWFAYAHDVSDNQCPKLNAKPTEDDYYALMSKEDADKERVENAKHGGVQYANDQMAYRGPHHLNACHLPGIVRDPGNAAPATGIARGFNLDGDDGRGNPPTGVCKHKNFVSADGKITGIDNQLFVAEGCVPGWMGHKGFLMQYTNEQMRNGLVSILVQISGIDNEKNDNSVDVSIFYSLDHRAKDASGKQMLPDYTFRLTDNPEYAQYFTRVHGKIVNGVVITDPVKELRFNAGLAPLLTLHQAQMRLEILPDGTLKGLMGGYQDWRTIATYAEYSIQEQNYDYQCPGLYNALKRDADGMKNPVTGECDGISSAYDIEGVPAFIAPAQPKVVEKAGGHRQVAQAGASDQKAR
jgi:hypothetical protein